MKRSKPLREKKGVVHHTRKPATRVLFEADLNSSIREYKLGVRDLSESFSRELLDRSNIFRKAVFLQVHKAAPPQMLGLYTEKQALTRRSDS